MSTIIPANSRIHETVGYTIDNDVYGLDVLTRNYEGPASDWVRFRSAFYDEIADTTFPDYFLVSRRAGSRRGSVITPTLTFKGVPGLSTGRFAVTKAQTKKALVTKTVTLKLSDGSGRTAEVEYKAPSTTWTYACGFEPTAPLHKGEMARFDGDFQIIRMRGATNFPVDFVTGPRPPVFGMTPRYLVYTAIYPEQFDVNQEGKAWTVTERNDGLLIGVEQRTTGGIGSIVPPLLTGN